MTQDQIAQLCKRINYSGALEPSSAVLRGIHHSWNHAVPFENFDIHFDRKIVLSPTALFDKIVLRNRGGFCFEQNGLLADLLRSLGFKVTLCAAAVISPTGELSPDLAHLCLLVDFGNEKYVADIGFGEYSAYPLLLNPDLIQGTPPEQYKIVVDGNRFRSVRVNEIPGWPKGYSFSTTPRELSDFTGMCDYFQTSPDSMFRKRRLCTRRRANGRDTLADEKLIDTTNGVKSEIPLPSKEAYAAAFRDRFGLPFSDAEVSRLWSARPATTA